MDWKDYLGKYLTPFKRDLALFPHILGDDISRSVLLRDRFRFLHHATDLGPQTAYEVWEKPEDAFLEEREAFPGSLTHFHVVSRTFPFLMAKVEVENLDYYVDIYNFFRKIPPTKKKPVLVVGPTFGGELEAITASGTEAYFLFDWESHWALITEERLLHDEVNFEDLLTNPQDLEDFSYVVVTPWVSDPQGSVRSIYDFLPEEGQVILPSRSISMTTEAANLGMKNVRKKLTKLSVFHKEIEKEANVYQ